MTKTEGIILRRLSTKEGRDQIREIAIDVINMMIECKDYERLVQFFESQLPVCDIEELLG